MVEQKAFEHAKCIELMLKIVGSRHEKLRERVGELWTRSKNRSAEAMFGIMGEEIRRFECAKTVADYAAGREPESKVQRLTFIEEEIMLSFLYPRMDYHVSTMQNHLLKLPFSVHPASKKISIPLFKRQLYNFDPEKCVDLGELLQALDEMQSESKRVVMQAG